MHVNAFLKLSKLKRQIMLKYTTPQVGQITSFLFVFILLLSSSATAQNNTIKELVNQPVPKPKEVDTKNPPKSKGQIATFFTFQKEDAEQAMNFYVGLFKNSEVIEVKRWEEGGPGKVGTIMHATFTLGDKLYMCSDSPPIHDWDFSPAVSNFVECQDESELEKLYNELSVDGKIFMPLNNYGFSQKFGWVQDKFGVSWQLNLK